MTCKKCSEDKPIDSFKKDSKYARGYRNICKECTAKRQREYWKNNPEQYKAHKLRVKKNDAIYNQSFRRHHITEERFERLKNKWSGACWICRYRDGVAIDHDHACCPGPYSCGKCIRGILCTQCNTALGLLEEDQIRISAMVNYIADQVRGYTGG